MELAKVPGATALIFNSVSLAAILLDNPSVATLWLPVTFEAVFLGLTLVDIGPVEKNNGAGKAKGSGAPGSLGLRFYAIAAGLGFLALGILTFIWFLRRGTGFAILGGAFALGFAYVSFLAIRGSLLAGKAERSGD